MGGQIIGLADNANDVDKIVAVNASYGNWKNYKGKYKITTAISWATLFPISTWWNGYFPANKFGMGEDWSKGVVDDWWTWSKYYLPHYKIMEKLNYPQFYYSVKIPILSYIMADDDIATVKTIPFFKEDYKNADLTVKVISPEDYQLKSIGHFGYFKEKAKPIWDETVEWLEKE
jgi:predicted alpha/beta hydrolase